MMKAIAKWMLGILVVLLTLIAVAGVVLYTFDWNRLKPRVNTMVSDAADREFAIRGNLDVAWQRNPSDAGGWRRYVPLPVIHANDVILGNPDWAEHEYMAEVAELRFGVELLPLLERTVVLRALGLKGATVALERQDTDNNSWTFKTGDEDEPENAGEPWKLTLSELEIAEGTLAYRDEPLQLALDAVVNSIADTQTAANGTEDAYGLDFEFKGKYREADIEGKGKSGALLSLRDPEVRYPLLVEGRSGEVEIFAEGLIGNLYEHLEVDLDVRLAAPSMAMLYPITGIVLPNTAPFKTDGHLTGKMDPDDSRWRYENFNGIVGKSDLHGTVEYTSGGARPKLTGEMQSDLLQFTDLGPLIGAGPKTGDPAAAEKRARTGQKTSNKKPGRVLPDNEFITDRWRAMDLDLRFTGKRIVRDAALPINNVRTHAVLDNGVLELKPLEFGVAGGGLDANITLNGRNDPMQVRMQASVRDVQLPKLFPTVEEMQVSAGRIDGGIALVTRGNSIAEMLGHSQGEIKLYLQSGRISRFLLEAASLNIASAIIAKLFGDSEVEIRCAAADMAVKDGLATMRNFSFGTTDALVDITGAIDLREERLALDVKPQSNALKVLSLRTPLYVDGTFADPDIGLEKGPIIARAAAVAAVAAVAPAALALLPMTVPGTDKQVDCNKLLASAREKPVTNPDVSAPIEEAATTSEKADNETADAGAQRAPTRQPTARQGSRSTANGAPASTLRLR